MTDTPPTGIPASASKARHRTLELAIGRRVGDYLVGQKLGEGGMGTVYHAHDMTLDRAVALKIMRGSVMRHKMYEQLKHEARAMARVRHPNVVTVYAYGEVDGAPYLVMEFIPGCDLGQWLDDRGPLSVDEALEVLRQVAAGVEAIHEAGLAHFDLKASNVLVGAGMRISIADLGLARIATGDDVGTLGATPGYSAPELFTRDPLDEHAARLADIYSLGAIGYELLVGQLPFDGDTPLEVAALQATSEARRPSRVRTELPPSFDEPLLRPLSFAPHERCQSVAAYMAAIEEARSTMSTVPQPPLAIMLADDDQVFQKIAKATLSKRFPDATIRLVSDGDTALAQLDVEGANIAIIDLHMPGLNGLELTAAIRGREAMRATKVVVATAVGGATDWRVLSTLGADALLLKPIASEDLVRTVERLMGLPPEAT